MPLHEYQCDACGHRFEAIRKFSDPPLETCPRCGAPVRKLVSAPAFQFKGSGWYVTDYAKKDSGKPEGGSKDSSGDKDTTKTEKSDNAAQGDKKSGTGDTAAGSASSSPAPGAPSKSDS